MNNRAKTDYKFKSSVKVKVIFHVLYCKRKMEIAGFTLLYHISVVHASNF